MSRDHEKITINTFRGRYNSGDNDSVPFGYFSDERNLMFETGEVRTRDGFSSLYTMSQVRRIYVYKRPGEVSRLIILNNSNQLFDSTNLATPLTTISGMIDFSVVNFFGRLYISPHDGKEGLPGQFIYMYDGSTFRQALGSKPTGTLVSSISATAGNVEKGTHLIAVSFETDTGYITKPGPVTFAVVVVDGTKKVDVTGIPTGPSGTVARRLLATKAILNYDGNQAGYEFFFIPEGRIANNTATSLTVNFYDADLQASADYLFDQKESLEACLGLSQYNGRMLAWNPDGNGNLVYVSRAGEPESIDSVEGFITVDPSEADTVKNCFEMRGTLYVLKSRRTYAYQDNGLAPVFWQMSVVDKGVGSEVYGVSTISDARGSSTERSFIADRSGLLIFDGTYRRPEITENISDDWSRINELYFWKVQVVEDPKNKCIYIAVPLDAATENSHILYADYQEGMTGELIKWSLWEFPFPTTCIALDIDSNNQSYLAVGSLNGNVHKQDDALKNDSGTAINSYFQSFGLFFDKGRATSHFSEIRVFVRGNGFFTPTLSSANGTRSVNLNSWTLSLTPGKSIKKLCNYKTERLYLRLGTSLFNEWFQVTEVNTFIKPLWNEPL